MADSRPASPSGLSPERWGGASIWLYLAGAALAAAALTLTGWRWLVPEVQALLVWPVLLRHLRRGQLGPAAAQMLFWALASSVFTIGLTVRFPSLVEAGILRSAAYRDEMFTWIRTDVGAEGDPRQFLPQHLLHYGLTLGLSFLTAGLAGLALGAVLLNYMNFYVGSLVAVGARPVLGTVFGWPIWSVFRVIAFVLGAIAAAELGLAVWARRRSGGHGTSETAFEHSPIRRLLLWSLAFFVADLAIKALLAPSWRRILMRALLP